jgi:hypothetical protein
MLNSERKFFEAVKAGATSLKKVAEKTGLDPSSVLDVYLRLFEHGHVESYNQLRAEKVRDYGERAKICTSIAMVLRKLQISKIKIHDGIGEHYGMQC